MLRQVHSPPGHVPDEEQLEHDLNDGQESSDGHQQVRLTLQRIQRPRDDAEDRLDEQTEGGDTQQDVVQVAALLAAELERLHATESDENGDQCEEHQHAVG